MSSRTWPWAHLRTQSEVIDRLAEVVEESPSWRWLEVCCSLAAGRGDELSDVDASIGYDGIAVDALERVGSSLLTAVGPVADVLVHVMPGWPVETRRLAAELETGAQLDLVLMPHGRRLGLPTGAVAVVDKDGRLATPWRPPVEDPPTAAEAREWLMLGWWALSDVAKYLVRGSLYEAVERLVEARQQSLRLVATGNSTPFPSYGLVSLLDFPPYDVPAGLSKTYATPASVAEVLAAATATADLLDESARSAGTTIGAPITTSWAQIARRRLVSVQTP